MKWTNEAGEEFSGTMEDFLKHRKKLKRKKDRDNVKRKQKKNTR